VNIPLYNDPLYEDVGRIIVFPFPIIFSAPPASATLSEDSKLI
jgi:hypothetical protein